MVEVTKDSVRLANYINALPGHPGCVIEFVKENKTGILYNAIFNDGIKIPFIEPKVVPIKMMNAEGMQFIVDVYSIEKEKSVCKDKKRWTIVAKEIISLVSGDQNSDIEGKIVDIILNEIDIQLKKVNDWKMVLIIFHTYCFNIRETGGFYT